MYLRSGKKLSVKERYQKGSVFHYITSNLVLYLHLRCFCSNCNSSFVLCVLITPILYLFVCIFDGFNYIPILYLFVCIFDGFNYIFLSTYLSSSQPQQTLHARVARIDIERFQVDLTCKSSDLRDERGEWTPPKDTYYDHETADGEKRQEDEQKEKQSKSSELLLYHMAQDHSIRPPIHSILF